MYAGSIGMSIASGSFILSNQGSEYPAISQDSPDFQDWQDAASRSLGSILFMLKIW
jgi:hypothetical protein